jgi:putative transcriptional regulator
VFNKSFLTNEVVKFLLKKEFEVFLTEGCFDIVARREHLMLIKTLINIDSLNESQALSLRAISYFISAYPFVISLKTNREFLDNKTIYSRFKIPVLTFELFKNILTEENVSVIYSAKGRHTVAIDNVLLKESRKKLQLSLDELSNIIGISKKALYEIENKRVNPTVKILRKLESVLGVNLQLGYRMKKAMIPTYLKPKNRLQYKVSKEFSRIGIDNSSVYSAPFEIIGREKFSLITTLSRNDAKLKKEANVVKKLSMIFSSQGIFITKKSQEQAIEGIPIILESELSEIASPREFSSLLKERVNVN